MTRHLSRTGRFFALGTVLDRARLTSPEREEFAVIARQRAKRLATFGGQRPETGPAVGALPQAQISETETEEIRAA